MTNKYRFKFEDLDRSEAQELNRTGRHYSRLGDKWKKAYEKRIDRLVWDLDTTKYALARKYGLDRKIFYGNGSAPSAEHLLILAEIFNCTTDYLLGREEAQHGNIPKEE